MCQKIGEVCTFVAQPLKKKKPDPNKVALPKILTGSISKHAKSSKINNSKPIKRSKSPLSVKPPLVNVPPMERPKTSNGDDKAEQNFEPPLIPDDFHSAALLGLSGDQDPYLLQYYNYDEQNTYRFVKYAIRRVSNGPIMPVQFLVLKNDDYQDPTLLREIDAQRQRINSLAGKFSERLLALYFRFVYPTYPIVDRQGFYYDYYHDKNRINVGLLAGLLALSCVWWKYDSVLCVNPMPQGLDSALYKECSIALERETKHPSLASVQCLLLLLQKRLLPSENAETFATNVDVARAVAISHNLGLHLDCSEWSIPPSTKRLRNRLWITLFIMEKWMAINTGRPSLLVWNNSTVNEYESDGATAQLFVQMWRLTRILDDIARDLYGVKLYEKQYHDVVETGHKVDHYFYRLQEWKDRLPDDLKDINYQPQGDFCKNGTLHLAALTIEVLLHKVRLHPVCSGLISKPVLREYRSSALDTIQRVIKFTSEITHSHLHAFWYSTTRLNFSTVAHFIFFHHVTSITSQEFKDTKEMLRKWLFALRVLSQGWQEGTGLATLRMDSVFWIGNKLFAGDHEEEEYSANGRNYTPDTDGVNESLHHQIQVRIEHDSEYHQNHHQNHHQNDYQQQSNYHNHMFKVEDNNPDMNQDVDEILLLNEDIMPQEDQTQLLEEAAPQNMAQYAEYFTADNYYDEGFLTSDLHELFQVHTNSGLAPDSLI